MLAAIERWVVQPPCPRDAQLRTRDGTSEGNDTARTVGRGLRPMREAPSQARLHQAEPERKRSGRVLGGHDIYTMAWLGPPPIVGLCM